MSIKTTTLIRMDPRDPDAAKIRDVVQVCLAGGLVAFPTETVYGIGAPWNIPGVREIIANAKDRDPSKPMSFHIGDISMVEGLDVVWTPALRFLARKFWPGPLTLLVSNKKGEKIGIRYPRNHITSLLIRAAGIPFLATSANLSGQPSLVTAQEVKAQLEGKVDIILDAGRSELAQDSTIVDLTQENPQVIREGADFKKIDAALELIRIGRFPGKRILFVCTGNSCRSPMAEGLLVAELKRMRLDDRIEVSSCGTGARVGAHPTYEAALALKNREIDISNHRSRACSREDLLAADMIFAMSEEHAGYIQGVAPEVKDRVRVLGIPDPIGMGMMIYEQVLAAIEKKLKACWAEIIR